MEVIWSKKYYELIIVYSKISFYELYLFLMFRVGYLDFSNYVKTKFKM